MKGEDSTKSHQGKKSRTNQTEHIEYGSLGFNGSSNIKKRKDTKRGKLDESKGLCEELLHNVEKWENLDDEHLKELKQMENLTSREKNRLVKIQKMEKDMLEKKVSSLKSRLRSESQI